MARELAVTILRNEVNTRDPQQAGRWLRVMIGDQDLSWALMEIVDRDNGEMFKQYLERIRHGGEEPGGSQP